MLSPLDLNLGLVLVYFIYGLAFFSMGIALLLETSRASLLAERAAIRLLAIFGLLHGMHEWLEIVLLQGVWLGVPFPSELSWLRVAWLVVSFVPLVIFGILMLGLPRRLWSLNLSIPLGLLVLHIILAIYHARLDPSHAVVRADALARYLLAIPGGVLAGLALRRRARQVQAEGRFDLSKDFKWAALGFGLYGLTQVFVPPNDMFPASYINSEFFMQVAGFPVQVVRAGMAVLVTLNLLRAIQSVERERQGELLAAQQARLEALEQIQRDLEEREAMRQELLRHIVIAQEEERARIARELHDETAQFLTALSLNLATLGNSIPKTQHVKELLQHLQMLTRQMSEGVYHMVHDLRPAQLDDLGLIAALQYLADEERKRTGLKATLQIEGASQRLDPLLETVFFRVAQEALTNITRHAQSDHATIQLQFTSEQVKLQVKDYGKGLGVGFPRETQRAWGLAGMRERAESVGGQFRIFSPLEGGTVVEVSVPFLQPNPANSKEAPHEPYPVNVG